MYKHRKGFSTVELLAVLVIFSIIAAIATQNFNYILSRVKINTTIMELVANIRHAQQIALGERINCYVVFDNKNKFYSIRVDANPTPKILKWVNFDKRIDITTSFAENRFHFTSLGAPSAGGTIYIKDSSGRTYRITIQVATGRVKVYY
ncbi:MAG TPA: type II secretion system protein [Thermoanaerobacterales bacterium]|nr:type II secretion system protein [Thermoanaerobacterales bacterium]